VTYRSKKNTYGTYYDINDSNITVYVEHMLTTFYFSHPNKKEKFLNSVCFDEGVANRFDIVCSYFRYENKHKVVVNGVVYYDINLLMNDLFDLAVKK